MLVDVVVDLDGLLFDDDGGGGGGGVALRRLRRSARRRRRRRRLFGRRRRRIVRRQRLGTVVGVGVAGRRQVERPTRSSSFCKFHFQKNNSIKC